MAQTLEYFLMRNYLNGEVRFPMLTYAAIFQDDPSNNKCHVFFPNLDYECCIDYSNNEQLLKLAEQELGFALWFWEDLGRKFPKSNTISDKDLPHGAVLNFISCDYDKFKQSISVKVIDLSD